MRSWIGVFLAVGLAAPISATARPLPVGGVTVNEVAAELQAKGYKAEIDKDAEGDPKITSGVDGSRFTVWFYQCKSGRCVSVQFESAFDLKDGMSFEKINDWNKGRRFAKAYLDDEKDPFVEYDVDFEVGATTEAIGNAIEVWVAIVPQFKEFIGF